MLHGKHISYFKKKITRALEGAGKMRAREGAGKTRARVGAGKARATPQAKSRVTSSLEY